MQLAHATRVQAHVHAGNVLGDAEFARRHLPGPTARLQSDVGIIEREAQVRQRAVVGGGWDKQIGILGIAHEIARPGIGASAARALRLRHRPARLCTGGGGRCEKTSGSSRCQHIAT